MTLSNHQQPGGSMGPVTGQFSTHVIELAQKNAVEMLQSKEELRKIQFGQASGTYVLTTNPARVVVDGAIEVEGVNFYLGLHEKPIKE